VALACAVIVKTTGLRVLSSLKDNSFTCRSLRHDLTAKWGRNGFILGEQDQKAPTIEVFHEEEEFAGSQTSLGRS